MKTYALHFNTEIVFESNKLADVKAYYLKQIELGILPISMSVSKLNKDYSIELVKTNWVKF